MFDIGGGELILIVLAVIVLFGQVKKLSEGIEFQRPSEGFLTLRKLEQGKLKRSQGRFLDEQGMQLRKAFKKKCHILEIWHI